MKVDPQTFLTPGAIESRVIDVAGELTEEYSGKNPVLVVVLNGAMYFAADLSRWLTFDHEIDTVRLSTYMGTQSTGKVSQFIQPKTSLEGRHVILVEDIVDTGFTTDFLRKELPIVSGAPASICVATLLYKKSRFRGEFPPEYVGETIPNHFVVGYGLDYNNAHRGIAGIHFMSEE